ncbi:MAG: cyclase family protein [Nitrospinota bacterium]|nr:MAG: cyclase family protein [Nitrospinota bacterium]
MAIVAAVSLLAALSLPAKAQTPTGSKWWPSEWGPDDQRGAMNRITPAKVLEAVSLIKEGKIYQLGRVYEPGMPLFGNRHYSLTIPGVPTGGPFGTNKLVYNDEMFSGEIGQIGTQFDGLGHIGTRVNGEDIFYNGFKLSEFGDSYGLKKIGVENVGVFFTRGVLLDVAAYKGVDRLEVGYVITIDDIKGTLEKEGIDIREGDVVIFRTGHGKLWMKDNKTYNSGEPGPGVTAIKWLVDKKIVMTASDTWATEAVPGEDPDRPFEGHQWLMNRNGIYNLENLDLEELAADKVYEFAFIFAPLRLKGATGSPGNPIAVR